MKSPAFQFYPKDWLSSRRVRMMTAEQRGWYIQLICEAWESEVQGTLPSDIKELCFLASADERAFNERSTPVIDMFKNKDGHLYHERLLEEVSKQQQYLEQKSNAGRASAKARRQVIKDKHLAGLNGRSTGVQRTNQREVNEGSLSASSSSSSIASSTISLKEDKYTEGFLAFWNAYPKRVGKGDAIKAWKKLKCDSVLPKILEQVAAQSACEQWKKDNGQFIPNPSTWINQERWHDEAVKIEDKSNDYSSWLKK